MTTRSNREAQSARNRAGAIHREDGRSYLQELIERAGLDDCFSVQKREHSIKWSFIGAKKSKRKRIDVVVLDTSQNPVIFMGCKTSGRDRMDQDVLHAYMGVKPQYPNTVWIEWVKREKADHGSEAIRARCELLKDQNPCFDLVISSLDPDGRNAAGLEITSYLKAHLSKS
jgi:hypothetical protein